MTAKRNTTDLEQRRVEALVGHAPTFTFVPDDAHPELCASVRLVCSPNGGWWGLIAHESAFADRIRRGLAPAFVVHHHGETPVLSGSAQAKILGRLVEIDEAKSRFGPSVGFSRGDMLVVEFSLQEFRVDTGESPAHGAVPRT